MGNSCTENERSLVFLCACPYSAMAEGNLEYNPGLILIINIVAFLTICTPLIDFNCI